MFAALMFLRILPPVAELPCEANLSIEIVVANTTEASCHRSADAGCCVVPDGFPVLPVLGAGLAGMDTKDFFAWLVAHPDSGFLASSAWVLSPDDVALLRAAGVACREVAKPSPTQKPGQDQIPVAAVLCLCVGCVAAALAVAALIAVFAKRREDQLLTASLKSYTQ